MVSAIQPKAGKPGMHQYQGESIHEATMEMQRGRQVGHRKSQGLRGENSEGAYEGIYFFPWPDLVSFSISCAFLSMGDGLVVTRQRGVEEDKITNTSSAASRHSALDFEGLPHDQ